MNKLNKSLILWLNYFQIVNEKHNFLNYQTISFHKSIIVDIKTLNSF